MKIVINGAGIAGPTLAYWLSASGHDVLLVEEAPRLRSGGYVIDFWGVGYDVADKMGLIEPIRAHGYQVREVRFVDRFGRRSSGFKVDVFTRLTGGRFTSVRRSDLAATIYGAIEDRVETIFGDSIAGIDDEGSRVHIRFEHAAARHVDLVVGADGLHSRVRDLVFGADAAFEVSMGYHVAAFEVDGYRPRDELVYVSHGAPGRQVSRFAMRDDMTLFLFVLRNEFVPDGTPAEDGARKAALRTAFADISWECPRILERLDDVESLYFDRVSQIRMPTWHKGRAVLIGDAAACVSLLAGEGTGLAMAEAYVLAGELGRAGGDHAAAFERYEARLRPFLAGKQRTAARFASSFAPKTAFGLRFRDAVLHLTRVPFLADRLVGRDLRDDIELPDYALA